MSEKRKHFIYCRLKSVVFAISYYPIRNFDRVGKCIIRAFETFTEGQNKRVVYFINFNLETYRPPYLKKKKPDQYLKEIVKYS